MRVFTMIGCLGLALTAAAKERNTVTLQVVDAQASEREYTQYVPGTTSTFSTQCNTHGSVYGTESTASLFGRTSCSTSPNPGTTANVVRASIEEVDVRAILPDGKHVTLWCQAGFRRCSGLKPGTYDAEISGNDFWIRNIDSDSVKSHKIKYRFAGCW